MEIHLVVLFFIFWLIICNNNFKTNLFNVRHSTKSKTSKLSVHNSWQPHFIHMYFNMEVFPMPAGAWTVITVGKDGPGHGIDQHFPNISSIRTDSTAPRNLNKNFVKSNFRFRNQKGKFREINITITWNIPSTINWPGKILDNFGTIIHIQFGGFFRTHLRHD